MLIRTLRLADAATLADSFAALGWHGRTVGLFLRYLEEQSSGERDVLVAELGGVPAGYLCVVWASGYEPFRAAGIPEIVDLYVRPESRRRGVATAVLDAAEELIAQRSPVAGIGCGLYRDYGPAMSLYLARGYRPDGRGIAREGSTVPVGATVRLDDSLTLMLIKNLA